MKSSCDTMLSSAPSAGREFFPAMSRRQPIGLALLAVLSFCTLHCATLHAPINPAQDRQEQSLRVEVLRADPEGLHLGLRAEDAAEGDDLEIWRAHHGEWTLVQTIAVTQDLVTPLQEGNAQWQDPLDDQANTYLYRLRQVGADQTSISPPVTADWAGWPDPPYAEAVAPSSTQPQVAISWNGDQLLETRIFRRDVLGDEDFSALAIVDAAAGGNFQDLDVEPGGVYAYQLQQIDRLGAFPRFGFYSQEIYVSVPE